MHRQNRGTIRAKESVEVRVLRVHKRLLQPDIRVVSDHVSMILDDVIGEGMTILMYLQEYEDIAPSHPVLIHGQNISTFGMVLRGMQERILDDLHELICVWQHAN